MKFTLPWQKAPAKAGRIGIAIISDQGAEALAVACLDAQGLITFAEVIAPTELAELVAKSDWTGMACSLVLAKKDYQVLLADVPDVPAEEVALAMRWRIKDLLNHPIQQTAVASAVLPADAYLKRQKKAYLAALQITQLEARAAIVEAAGLALDCIEINEFALHNLHSRMDVAGGAILLHLFERGGLLNMVEGGQLYLTRESEQGLAALITDQQPNSHWDELLLEVQRSRDFYESQMGKGIITRLHYSPDRVDMLPLAEFLASQLGLVAEPLELERVLPIAETISLDKRAACSLAIGAALGARDDNFNQQINLYEQLPRNIVQAFNVRQQIQAAVAVAVLVVCYGLLQIVLLQSEKHKLTAQQQRYEQAQTELTALTTRRNAMDSDKTLEVAVAKLEKRQQFLESVVKALTRSDAGGGSFAEQLMGLARQHQEGLWLTHIEFFDGGAHMALRGKTTDPSLLPQYIQRLSAEPVFTGQAFKVFKLQANKKSTEMDFELRSGDAIPAAKVAARGNGV